MALKQDHAQFGGSSPNSTTPLYDTSNHFHYHSPPNHHHTSSRIMDTSSSNALSSHVEHTLMANNLGHTSLKRYDNAPHLPRPKEFYKKKLEEIAELLEKKFKQATPHELEYVSSPEAHDLFMTGYSLFQEILQYQVTINSDTFRAWVLIQRWSGRMQRPEMLYGQIKQLGIHRPSFRLCASILTSYANGSYQLSKPEYVQWAIDSLAKMKEHNYVPNTYVYNALFVMCNKNQLYPEVWKFFIELMLNSDPSSNNLDGFTCASLMETCVAEQNPQKGIAIYDMFRRLPTPLKKNNEKYILQLKTKLDDIYEEQSRSFDFAALHERWQEYKPYHYVGGTSSGQSSQSLSQSPTTKSPLNEGGQDYSSFSDMTGPQHYYENFSPHELYHHDDGTSSPHLSYNGSPHSDHSSGSSERGTVESRF